MEVLLLGSNGQVGRALVPALAEVGDLVVVCRRDNPLADLSQPQALAAYVRDLRPAVVVNAAAYTQVDAAEQAPALAHVVNAAAPTALADACAELGALLVHYSSDYVFDGSGTRAWRESDPTNPLNVYGASKVAGERGIRASGCAHLILRTSWVYGDGKNFIASLLRRAMTDTHAPRVVMDQVGAPTGAKLLARASVHALKQCLSQPGLAGTYHLTAQGHTSWYELATQVLTLAHQAALPLRFGASDVTPIASADFATAARRPLNSRLDCSAFTQSFGFELPPWQTGVADYLDHLVAQLRTAG